mmetsp:Transcript_10503/g.30455  ORF Transcript_10503/g.30455 Transcript_10503/m.30455 type:complete len:294 (+) Transcript_10503:514-1395(+)
MPPPLARRGASPSIAAVAHPDRQQADGAAREPRHAGPHAQAHARQQPPRVAAGVDWRDARARAPPPRKQPPPVPAAVAAGDVKADVASRGWEPVRRAGAGARLARAGPLRGPRPRRHPRRRDLVGRAAGKTARRDRRSQAVQGASLLGRQERGRGPRLVRRRPSQRAPLARLPRGGPRRARGCEWGRRQRLAAARRARVGSRLLLARQASVDEQHHKGHLPAGGALERAAAPRHRPRHRPRPRAPARLLPLARRLVRAQHPLAGRRGRRRRRRWRRRRWAEEAPPRQPARGRG